MPRRVPAFSGTPIDFGTTMSSVSVPAPMTRSGASYSSMRRLKFTMIMWCSTSRGIERPWPSTIWRWNPRNQASIGQSNCWIGVSWAIPKSIICMSSIGGMFGRSNGPAMITISLLLESTARVTVGSGGPLATPEPSAAASSTLTNIFFDSTSRNTVGQDSPREASRRSLTRKF